MPLLEFVRNYYSPSFKNAISNASMRNNMKHGMNQDRPAMKNSLLNVKESVRKSLYNIEAGYGSLFDKNPNWSQSELHMVEND